MDPIELVNGTLDVITDDAIAVTIEFDATANGTVEILDPDGNTWYTATLIAGGRVTVTGLDPAALTTGTWQVQMATGITGTLTIS